MNRLTKAAVVALALSTSAVPLLAQAQPRPPEPRHERHDPRWGPGPGPDHRGPGWDRHRGPRPDYRPAPPRDRWDRNDPNWWRGRSDFRSYNGPRSGYWYAPSYGYYRVEPRYSNYRWRTGGYLPTQYRTYYVRDPYFYGLREAPRGYRYVHAGNDILLISVATGLIASVLSNVY